MVRKIGAEMTTATTDKADKTRKIIIRLPASLLELVDTLVQERQSNRSAIIAELLGKIKRERYEIMMREAYLANAEEAEEIAEEYIKLVGETWPVWD